MPDNLLNKFLSERQDDFSDIVDQENLELEPVAGDEVVGNLTEEERIAFINLIGIDSRIEELSAEAKETFDKALGAGIASGSRDIRLMVDTANRKAMDDTTYEEAMYLISLRDKVSTAMWFGICKRLQKYSYKLNIRAGFTIVSTGKKGFKLSP